MRYTAIAIKSGAKRLYMWSKARNLAPADILIAMSLVLASLLMILQAAQADSAAPPQAEPPRTVEYTLTIAREKIAAAPRKRLGIAINGTIPGPTLYFREGDHVRVSVVNQLDDDDASIHWHGLLLPNAMDGVPYLTTKSLEPHAEHVFEFDLRQSGTYWYHSHTGLQEQEGVYGAIVIEPREGRGALHAQLGVAREVVAVLSDWTDEPPREVMRTLMRGSDWYSIKKGNAQTLLDAWKRGKLGEYFAREKRRMPAMDISDVAYDQFLVNGLPEARAPEAAAGERVLVRVVNASASTYFHLTQAGGPVTIVSADGQRVQPVDVRRLLIGIAETYDIVVSMPASGQAVELRATAHDGTSHTALVLGRNDAQVLRALDPPPPERYGMDEMLRAGLSSASETKALATATEERPFAPYALLRTREPSSIALIAKTSVARAITMRLTGDMERYLWSIDGKTLAEAPPVRISSGEVVRIEFINDTMMHHPMHLHGHFFRVVTAAGEFSPVKHTVDVPPMGRRTIEFVADEEPGDWFLHCHILYHMDAGMARVLSYLELGADHQPVLDPAIIAPSYLFLDAAFLSNMTQGHAMLMTGRNDFFARWHSGYGNGGNDEMREVDLGMSHYYNPNLSALAGYRFTTEERAEDRLFAGARYRLPYLVYATATADSEAGLRFELEKSLRLSARWSLVGRVEYDTNTYTDLRIGTTWTLSKALAAIAQYDSDHGLGVGVTVRL